MQGTDEGLGSDSDAPRGGQAQPAVPDLSKLGLPASLKRDLTRHIGPKGKAGGHEPNLNIARRIRNLSGARKGEAEKDSGLKPTLRQLISSTGSRRNVNWDQVYQEVSRKKQEQGKGMPRFGIEMVTSVPYDMEGLSQEEGDDSALTEGYQWDSICESYPALSGAGPRKRSLSESSVVGDRASATLSMFPPPALKAEPPRDWADGPPRPGSEPQGTSHSPSPSTGLVDPEKEGKPSSQGPADVEGDSSCASETEQNDTQGLGKKRRAAGEIPSPEISSLERKNKRRKIKCKKERSQVDQLLAVSLREEELSSSLQAVDSSLIQARAALQAAYMEVQRLLVVKQQVTMEMSTLRTRRIEILQGMQEGYDAAALLGGNSGAETPVAATAPALQGPFSPLAEIPAYSPAQPPPAVLPAFLQRAPPPSSLPTAATATPTLHIKQEPVSPSSLSAPEEKPHRAAYGPEPQLTAPLTESVQPKAPRASRSGGPASALSRASASRRRDSQPGASDRTELLTEASTGGGTSNLASTSPAPPPPPSSSSQPEPKGGKRVRKLRKKKTLKKAPGQEQPENSDTEQDGDGDTSSRPVRRAKTKKKAKGAQEQGGAESEDSSLEMVELPQATPLEVVSIDSSDAEGGPAARVSAKTPAPPDAAAKPEPRNLGCDEVSSTSELDATARTKACASQTQPAPVTVKVAKENSGEFQVSSELGEVEEPTEGAFEGHQGSVNTMQVHNGLLYTCSSDRTVRAFDLVTRKCVAVFEGHSTKVNCLLVTCGQGMHQRLYTGSSDQTIRCYNVTTRQYVEWMRLPDRVLCLHNRWKVLYAGLANGSVVSFSQKNNRQLDVFDCHGPRAVSCIVSAQEGARRILLVGSYDCTISVRDAKNGLLLRTLEGHTKTVLCMKVVNDLVFSGSSDQSVHAHNIHTGELVRIYKGHTHAVTMVAILGKVMVTACLDKLVRVYELQSHDRLQVYGGHKDMVMCMAIHKSMIYTGCYDGSVQAVRLNLIQNHRCWWHGCSLIFGVKEHLQQHLLNDHTSPNFQTLKCRWKNCDAFFTVRNSSKQEVPLHMQQHAEEDSKLEA
ncbi:hypothetical protein AAFF_G00387100 [Aldrovandia affinis]|uniref:C2H2-type domain-containing protein n=1 Tax=Aldrovandia affinis TaxID=143900 RepID=A0AAD7WLG6_9TELE|nr:hypothetical protein AAFF_G00387100 [Aldrovandia affinis]